MERQRRSFTEEYKRQAVELVVSSRRSITSVAKELGLRDSVLRRWVDKLRQEPTSATGRPTTQATPMPADQASESAHGIGDDTWRTVRCAIHIAAGIDLTLDRPQPLRRS